MDVHDPEQIKARVHQLAQERKIVYGPYASSRMTQRHITTAEVMNALMHGELVENYPDDVRGASCLMHGEGNNQRPIHVVCTTSKPELFVITVYEPTEPKWLNLSQRRR